MDIGIQDMEVNPGIHMLLVYHEAEQAVAVAAKVMAPGLSRGEKCIFCSSCVEELHSRLALEGIKREEQKRAEKEARLVIIKAREELLADDCLFDPDEIAANIHSFIKDAEVPVRVFLDVTWLNALVTGGELVFELEERLDKLFDVPGRKVLCLCIYSMSRLTNDDFLDLLDKHQISIVGEQVTVNPHQKEEAASVDA